VVFGPGWVRDAPGAPDAVHRGVVQRAARIVVPTTRETGKRLHESSLSSVDVPPPARARRDSSADDALPRAAADKPSQERVRKVSHADIPPQWRRPCN
jgi:hypothetical protein